MSTRRELLGALLGTVGAGKLLGQMHEDLPKVEWEEGGSGWLRLVIDGERFGWLVPHKDHWTFDGHGFHHVFAKCKEAEARRIAIRHATYWHQERVEALKKEARR